MTLEEAMKRIEALEVKLEMTTPAPEVDSFEIPDGWMLVNSEDIPWSDDDPTWEIYDPDDHDTGWPGATYRKPRYSCLIVARPDPDA